MISCSCFTLYRFFGKQPDAMLMGAFRDKEARRIAWKESVPNAVRITSVGLWIIQRNRNVKNAAAL